MKTKISIDRTSAGGRYADILDVAEHLTILYGSSANAVAVMVRQSRIFKEASNDLKRLQKDQRAAESASGKSDGAERRKGKP